MNDETTVTWQRRPSWLTVLVVFGITGTLSVFLGRFLLNDILHQNGSLWGGPWSYRLVYLMLMPPTYSAALVTIGTIFGQHTYFKRRVLRIWGRFLPKRVYTWAWN